MNGPDWQTHKGEKELRPLFFFFSSLDVWLQGKFGWEYKEKHKDLQAFRQLLDYREDGMVHPAVSW